MEIKSIFITKSYNICDSEESPNNHELASM